MKHSSVFFSIGKYDTSNVFLSFQLYFQLCFKPSAGFPMNFYGDLLLSNSNIQTNAVFACENNRNAVRKCLGHLITVYCCICLKGKLLDAIYCKLSLLFSSQHGNIIFVAGSCCQKMTRVSFLNLCCFLVPV